MKTFRILVFTILIAVVGGLQAVIAQTFHKDLYAEINNEYVFCLNKQLTGSWTYNVSWHVNKKTGAMTNLHWNVKSDLRDSDGNRYTIIDTGHDSMGYFWELFNNLNAYNAGLDITYFDVEDGWLPVSAGPMPQSGTFMNNFKFIGNGEKFYWKSVMRMRLDENGEIQIDLVNENIDCNE